MTTSGTYTFSLDAAGIVSEAWERLQFGVDEMKGWQLRSARISLNLMFLEWATRGINLWAVELVSFGALTQGVATAATSTGTIDILEVYTTVNGQDFILGPIGRDDYAGIPDKTTQSRPTQYWCERVLPAPILHLYPVPDGAATYTLSYYRMRQLQDISAYTQTADAPALFLEAICAGLAARLAGKWVRDPVLRGELRSNSLAAFKQAFSQDTERVELSITPDMTGWGW